MAGFRSRKRSRRRRINPRILGKTFSPRGLLNYAIPALTGAAGGIGLNVALAYVPLPEEMKSGWTGALVKTGGAVLLGLGVGTLFGRKNGVLFTGGALTILAYQILSNLASQAFGDKIKGLSGYQDFTDYQLPSSMGAYMTPALSAPSQQMGAYMNPSPVLSGYSNLGAYMDSEMGMF